VVHAQVVAHLVGQRGTDGNGSVRVVLGQGDGTLTRVRYISHHKCSLTHQRTPNLPPGVMLIIHYRQFQNVPIGDITSGKCPPRCMLDRSAYPNGLYHVGWWVDLSDTLVDNYHL